MILKDNEWKVLHWIKVYVTERKMTNQHVSELNVFMKMGYELVKAR